MLLSMLSTGRKGRTEEKTREKILWESRISHTKTKIGNTKNSGTGLSTRAVSDSLLITIHSLLLPTPIFISP